MLEEKNRKWLLALVVVVVLLFIAKTAKYSLVVSANKAVVATTVSLQENTIKTFEVYKDRHSKAEKVHLAKYFEPIKVGDLEVETLTLKKMLSNATNLKNPDHKMAANSQIRKRMKCVDAELLIRNQKIDYLDSAKANFYSEPKNAEELLKNSKKVVKILEEEGYFTKHFEESKRLNQSSWEALSKAKSEVSKNEKGDYVVSYDLALSSQKDSCLAIDLAQRIPKLRAENEERIAVFGSNKQKVAAIYEDSVAYAQKLERYPRYRRLANVHRAYLDLTNVSNLVVEATKLNDFSIQDFNGASRLLSQAEGNLERSKTVFQGAIRLCQQIENAVARIAVERSAASRQIDSADSHKDSYDYNSQSESEDLLSRANSALSSARLLEDSDPIESLSKYQSAKSYADQAYNSVDTSSRHSSSNDTGSILNSGGGNSGGGSMGGGFGGPTGGDYGGPTGGGFGSSDF